MSESHALGRLGESLARLFLEHHGFTCAAAGFRRAGGELDLVMRQGSWVVFVEVKTRGPRSPAPPEAWVTPLKLSRMRRAARHWIHENPPPAGCRYRFDVVAIEVQGSGRGLRLRHLEGVG